MTALARPGKPGAGTFLAWLTPPTPGGVYGVRQISTQSGQGLAGVTPPTYGDDKAHDRGIPRDNLPPRPPLWSGVWRSSQPSVLALKPPTMVDPEPTGQSVRAERPANLTASPDRRVRMGFNQSGYIHHENNTRRTSQQQSVRRSRRRRKHLGNCQYHQRTAASGNALQKVRPPQRTSKLRVWRQQGLPNR